MKTWDELTEDQRRQAIDKIVAQDLEDIVTGAIRFDDKLNGDNLQAAIDEALAESEANQTPWFAHEFVLEARYWPGEGHAVEDDGLWPVSELLKSLAIPVCEDALYSEERELVIEGIV